MSSTIVVPTPKLELFLTDIHFPTEDPAVWDLELQVARALHPDLVWLNGDVMDFESISRFRVDPKKRFKVGEEFDYAKGKLADLRRAVGSRARMVFLEGNHDARLQHFMWDRAPELSGVKEMRIPSMLGLARLDCAFYENGEKVRVGELHHLHGNEVATGYTYPARNMLAKVVANVIFGHVHRFSVAHHRDLGGRVRVAWSIGCTQSLEVAYDFHTAGWTNGFALVEYTHDGLFHITPIEVFALPKGGKGCIVYGRFYNSSAG